MKKLKFKQKKTTKPITLGYFVIIGLFITILSIIGYLSFVPKSNYDTHHILHIPPKSSVHDIAVILKSKKLIHSINYFKLTTKLAKLDTQFKAGYFSLPPVINQRRLTHILTTQYGNHNLIKITIPEGFSIAEIAARLEKNNICKAYDFETFCHKNAKTLFQSTYPFLNQIPLTTIEGYLFPETYFFKHDEAIKTVVSTMLKQFNKEIYLTYKDVFKNHKYSFHDLPFYTTLVLPSFI